METELILLLKQFLLEEDVALEFNLETSLQNELGIDSLSKAELFSRIEKKYQTSFENETIGKMDNLQQVLKFISTQ